MCNLSYPRCLYVAMFLAPWPISRTLAVTLHSLHLLLLTHRHTVVYQTHPTRRCHLLGSWIEYLGLVVWLFVEVHHYVIPHNGFSSLAYSRQVCVPVSSHAHMIFMVCCTKHTQSLNLLFGIAVKLYHITECNRLIGLFQENVSESIRVVNI